MQEVRPTVLPAGTGTRHAAAQCQRWQGTSPGHTASRWQNDPAVVCRSVPEGACIGASSPALGMVGRCLNL